MAQEFKGPNPIIERMEKMWPLSLRAGLIIQSDLLATVYDTPYTIPLHTHDIIIWFFYFILRL